MLWVGIITNNIHTKPIFIIRDNIFFYSSPRMRKIRFSLQKKIVLITSSIFMISYI